MDAVIASGLKGVQVGLEAAAASADRVTRAFQPEGTEDPVSALLDLSSAKRQVEAGAAVIKVGDKMLGSILDILG
jgi:hypothetical protein